MFQLFLFHLVQVFCILSCEQNGKLCITAKSSLCMLIFVYR